MINKNDIEDIDCHTHGELMSTLCFNSYWSGYIAINYKGQNAKYNSKTKFDIQS